MVRNFWIEIVVDGRKTKVRCGPRGSTGGFDMKIYQRSNGSSIEVVNIRGTSQQERLQLDSHIGKNNRIMLVTHR